MFRHSVPLSVALFLDTRSKKTEMLNIPLPRMGIEPTTCSAYSPIFCPRQVYLYLNAQNFDNRFTQNILTKRHTIVISKCATNYNRKIMNSVSLLYTVIPIYFHVIAHELPHKYLIRFRKFTLMKYLNLPYGYKARDRECLKQRCADG